MVAGEACWALLLLVVLGAVETGMPDDTDLQPTVKISPDKMIWETYGDRIAG